mgnify:CR=1 FL=1
MKLEEIIRIISQSEIKIRSFGVRRLGIFGSFIKGTNTESSDIDILVNFEDVPKIAKAYFGLKFYLEDLLNMEVDLCRDKDIRIELKDEIMKSVKYILDEKWQILLRKAKTDLSAATILDKENSIHKETILFHLEQAVEKLLKALLEKNNKSYAEVDDLMILKKFTQEWLNFDDEQISLLEELNNYRFEKYSENFELNDVNDVNKYFDFVVEIERKVMEML